MDWLRNLSLTGKLGSSFGALTVLLALAGGIGLRGQSQLNERTAAILRHADGLNHLQEANGELLRISRAVRNAILEDAPSAVDRQAADIRAADARFRTEFGAYRPSVSRDEHKAKAAAVERQFNDLRAIQDEVVTLARQEKDAEAKTRLPRIHAAADAIEQDINGLVDSKQQQMTQLRTEADEVATRCRELVGATVAAGCALSVALGVLLSRLTARPLQKTMGVLEAVAKGDLRQRAEVGSADEIGRLALALNAAVNNMEANVADMARVQAMIDSAPINVMFADREFKIRYANTATLKTLKSIERLLPIPPDRLLGQSIDIFHKRPEHQRRLLNDPKNLPHSAHISLGPETLELNINPVFDQGRNYIGAMVTWAVITERLALERQVRENAERTATQAAELQQKIGTIMASVSALAAGDFTVSIPDLGADNVGQMAAGLNQAVESVRTALEGVKDVSEQLADASAQLSSASEEISSGAQEQASSLEEAASTLEEITTTVRQNADSAQQARQLAGGSREVAEKGGQVVSGAVDAMSEINESSKKIAEIITTIDEIAFQTNLLALNAAVEAARAGEQGRGFAVVATEVRNLAQRSATAAKEIKALIQDSVRKVDAGTELVNQSGTTLAEIVTSVKRVTDIVTEIASAGKEQSAGIEQVNRTVSQMDTVTQRNAGQTEELSATAHTLTEQAAQLRDLVARFKLTHGHESAASRPAARKSGKSGGSPRPAPKTLGTGHKKSGRPKGAAHDLDALGGSGDGFADF